MNPLMAFGTYDECFSSHPAHGEHPVICPFQVLEFLDLMNLKLFRPLSAQLAAVPLYSLFQGICLGILRELG